jgi:hypothetical protein
LKRLSMSENDYMKNTSAKMQTYRLSKAIIRKDSEGQIYDLSEQLVTQFHYFPHGGKVDLIDAFSRIYDMEIAPPVVQDYSTWKLEPEMPW